MIKLKVELEDNVLELLAGSLNLFTGRNGEAIMPSTARAFNLSSAFVQQTWRNWALGGALQGVRDIVKPSANLASSIRIERTNPFDHTIFTNSPYMRRIESGRREFDMKEKYPYGIKSRKSKNNIPYLIIPFRWGTPNNEGGARAHFANSIPLEAYKILQAKTFKASKRTGRTHIEPNAKGESIRRSEYVWGDRYESDPGSYENGMVKMGSTAGKSTYFTFRIISAKSPKDSWIQKEIPANHVVEAVKNTTEEQIKEWINESLREDLGIE